MSDDIERRLADAEWKGSINQQICNISKDVQEIKENNYKLFEKLFQEINDIKISSAKEGGKMGALFGVAMMIISNIIGYFLYRK